MSESRILTREEEIRAGAWRGKNELHSEGGEGGKQQEPP